MTRRRWTKLAGCALAACLALPAPAGPGAAPSPAEEIVVEIPGGAISLAWTRPDGKPPTLFVLFRPAPPARADDGEPKETRPPEPCETGGAEEAAPPAPLQLAAVELGARTSSRVVATDLPGDAGGIRAMDVGRDGREELVLFRPGRLEQLDLDGDDPSGASLRVLAKDPGMGASPAGGDAADRRVDGTTGLLALPVLGGVRFFHPEPGGGALDDVIELPLSAFREGQLLRLRSPVPRRIAPGPGQRPIYAVGPEPHGHRRLRTLLLDPEADEASRRTEWWSRLPGPEKILESRYTRIDGRPALIVTTRPADKLSFFGEKLLRVFLVDEPDRSRTGAEPLFAVETRINLWQRAEPAVLDVDLDGRDDLVVGYWKGIKDDTMVLDAYLRRPDGSFSRSERTTRFDLDGADRSVLGFGPDLDGDGQADLLLHAGGRGLIYPGDYGASGGGHLVAAEPLSSFRWASDSDDEGSGFDIEIDDEVDEGSWMIPPGDGFGPCRVVDLDGDGRPEILLVEPADRGRDYLKIIRPGRRRPGPS